MRVLNDCSRVTAELLNHCSNLPGRPGYRGRMQRANGAVRRAQILAASGQLVRRRGFTATRMADVAAELGLSALIVYHFRTKDS